MEPDLRKTRKSLKLYAEQAKIRVSEGDSTEIIIDNLCLDDRGEAVRLEYELSRRDVERLMEPFVLRTVNIAKRVMAEKRLGLKDAQRVLLVGGPTLSPFVRQMLADPKDGLGIPLDFSVDPLTIVARGAAIFAGNQRLEAGPAPAPRAGQIAVTLNYQPISSDTEPLVNVQLGFKAPTPGYTIEFINTLTHWRSGKLPLAANGAAIANLLAEKGAVNPFEMEVFDPQGNRVDITPSSFPYTVGLVTNAPPLIHSIGVALANNQVLWFFEKGASPFPLHRREVLRSAFAATRNKGDMLITIPVIEGDNALADRNMLIGTLEISGEQIKRDLPAGSEIEVTIDIDESRLVRTRAYIPLLNEEFEGVLKLEKALADPVKLQAELEKEKERLSEIRQQVAKTSDPDAQAHLQRIEEEKIVRDVDENLQAAQADRDAGDKCAKRILDLRQALDEAQKSLEWPTLVSKAQSELAEVSELVENKGNDVQKKTLMILGRSLQQAIERHHADRLRQLLGELSSLQFEILQTLPEFWLGFFKFLETHRAKMRNVALADQLFTQGQRAMHNNDITALRAASEQLFGLLNSDAPETARAGYGSWVVR